MKVYEGILCTTLQLSFRLFQNKKFKNKVTVREKVYLGYCMAFAFPYKFY